MDKICSLDFLNKEEFDVDVLSSEGEKLFSQGDIITPEILLKLYFKDIYKPKPVEKEEEPKERVRSALEEISEEINLDVVGNWKEKVEQLKLQGRDKEAEKLKDFMLNGSDWKSQVEDLEKQGRWQEAKELVALMLEGTGNWRKTEEELELEGTGNWKKDQEDLELEGTGNWKKDQEDLELEGTGNWKKDQEDLELEGTGNWKKDQEGIELEGTGNWKKDQEGIELEGTGNWKKDQEGIELEGTGNWKKDQEDLELQSRDAEDNEEIKREEMKTESESDETSKESDVAKKPAESKEQEELEDETDYTKPLEFDKAHAVRVQEMSVKLGVVLKFSEGRLEELGQAAYYHDLGRASLKEGDLKEPNFKILQAKAGYKAMIEDMDFPERIAEVAGLHLQTYDHEDFKLHQSNVSKTPYHHVVAIANYYDELVHNRNYSPNQAIDKLVRLGGYKFNVFILHKFVRMMRG